MTPDAGIDLVVIDEIGKMECLSAAFVERVRLCLESDVPVLATVARRGGGFIADVRRRPDAAVWEVTRDNRDALPERVLERLEQARVRGATRLNRGRRDRSGLRASQPDGGARTSTRARIYELEIDAEGWAPVVQLIAALREKRGSWQGLSRHDLTEMMKRSNVRRYELRGDRIRALYGHSVPGMLQKKPKEPPDRLFHGTSPEAARSILDSGLQPMQRQYVHLSVDVPTARQVGSRKSARPVILTVRSISAWRDGVSFYAGNDRVWLADAIPPSYVEPLDRSTGCDRSGGNRV